MQLICYAPKAYDNQILRYIYICIHVPDYDSNFSKGLSAVLRKKEKVPSSTPMETSGDHDPLKSYALLKLSLFFY